MLLCHCAAGCATPSGCGCGNEWWRILPLPVCPLAGPARFGQNTSVGSMTGLLALSHREGESMSHRTNRAIELLASGQPIYYVGGHSGHILTHAQGVQDAKTWADYINVGMEHGAFDMAGLDEYMRGLVDGGPTSSGHRTPTVIV